MRRISAAVLAGVLAVAAASSAQAQYVYLQGGLNLPVSGFNEDFKTGWIAGAGLGLDLGTKLWVEAEGFYGSNKAKDTGGDKLDLWAALGALGYTFMPDKKMSPYILAGAGLLGVKDGETSFAYTGALGLGYNASTKVHLFLEGRWLAGTGDNSGAKMIPITAGVTIMFGN